MEDILISVLSDALYEKNDRDILNNIELDEILAEAIRHGVAGSFIQGLPADYKLSLQPLEGKLHALDMGQEYEGNEILQRMAKRGIPCIPLKGWILRNIYPHTYMRTMGDLDLLIPPDRLMEAGEVMAELAYFPEKESFTDYHICYYKQAHLLVEIHSRLTEEINHPVLDRVWDRAVKGEDGYYKLSDEDFYIFLIYHAAKHVMLGGIGLRYIMDLWVLLSYFYQNSVPIVVDQVLDGLNQLSFLNFAAYSEQLATEWFGPPGISLARASLDPQAMDLWRRYVLSSGAFGELASTYENQLAKESSFTVLRRKVFPSKRHMEIRYPDLIQKPWLMPKFYFIRLRGKLQGGEALMGANAIRSIPSEKIEERKYLLGHLGLKR